MCKTIFPDSKVSNFQKAKTRIFLGKRRSYKTQLQFLVLFLQFGFLFSALADLYEGIGFKRKAAFFLRVAAMRCVAPQNPHPDWSLCYSLLLKATSGYYLDLTRTVALKTEYIGWPDLQVSKLIDAMIT